MIHMTGSGVTMHREVPMPVRGVRASGVGRLRRRMAWTQQELAEKADVDRKTVNRAENGIPVDVTVIRKLAAALGVEPAALVDEEA